MWEDLAEWIALEDCEHGVLYKIAARNFRIGIYDEPTKSFVGIRTKFDRRFLDKEYHWDTGEPYGTAKPIGRLEASPFKDLGLGQSCDAAAIAGWLAAKEPPISEP